ncbi:hypothetical protein M9H77_08840 [Catharanthus roseus]|uniref:Uncharacterized protein n=1 Tax=Catharanthus roseus TaxID=4058 RepID=A0ACC0BZ05_CATRO|nr:hypothetical protein M9H77_08840 [Catharanthus roseus]
MQIAAVLGLRWHCCTFAGNWKDWEVVPEGWAVDWKSSLPVCCAMVVALKYPTATGSKYLLLLVVVFSSDGCQQMAPRNRVPDSLLLLFLDRPLSITGGALYCCHWFSASEHLGSGFYLNSGNLLFFNSFRSSYFFSIDHFGVLLRIGCPFHVLVIRFSLVVLEGSFRGCWFGSYSFEFSALAAVYVFSILYLAGFSLWVDCISVSGMGNWFFASFVCYWAVCICCFVPSVSQGNFSGWFLAWVLGSCLKCSISTAQHTAYFFAYCFDSEADKQRILDGGLYMIYSRPLILKNMPNLFEYGTCTHTVVLVWVTLPSLPVDLWNAQGLGKICSKIGNPLCSDAMTGRKERIFYARVLVEVDMAKELVSKVTIKLPYGNRREQHVIYENFPK